MSEYEGVDPADYSMLQDDIGLDRELASRSFREYVELAWPQVEPSQPFVGNWHIDSICDVLESVKLLEILRLIVNVPPGVGKSLLVSVLFPSWLWTIAPGTKVLSGSYNEDLAKRDTLRSRTLMESPWWRARWGHQMQPNKAAWASGEYRNKQGGLRKAVGVATGVTGEHGHVQIVDDPHKPYDISGPADTSKASLKKVSTWWSQTMSTRFVERSTGARIIVMQRLHEGDLSGLMLAEGGYHHLCLPMMYEPKVASFPTKANPEHRPCPIKKCKSTHDPDHDPRTESGELLDKIRSPAKAVATQRRELGSHGAAAQHDQIPGPADGSIFKKHQFRYYRKADLPKRFQRQIQSWDMTFKKTDSGSWVVGQVWGQIGADCYLLDQVRERMGMSATCAAVRKLSLKWPKAHKKLVEAKANGEAVVDTLKGELTGLTLVNPDGGKEARANSVEPVWESGNVWIPHPEEQPWAGDFEEEVLGFPAVVHDDQVDTMTQAVHFLRRHGLNRLRAAMANT